MSTERCWSATPSRTSTTSASEHPARSRVVSETGALGQDCGGSLPDPRLARATHECMAQATSTNRYSSTMVAPVARRRFRPESARNGVEPPVAGDAFEFMGAALLEGQP